MKKAVRVFLFGLLLSLVLLLTYRILSWKDTSGEYISSVHQLQITPHNTIDVAFLGSSHVYCGVAPHILWDEYGIAGFDMTVSGMDKWSLYSYTEYLLRTQNPQIICVDAFSLFVDKPDDVSNEYRNMLSMPTSLNQIELVKDYTSDKKKRTDYILKWPIIHTRYKEVSRGDFIYEGFEDYGRGEQLTLLYGSADLEAGFSTDESTHIAEDNKEVVDRFISLSERTGIPIVFMVVPYEQNESIVAGYNGIRDYLENVDNVFFVNGNTIDEIGIDSNRDFIDFQHLNKDGAEKFTRWLGKYISEIVPLEDNRGKNGYELWDYDLVYYSTIGIDDGIRNFIDMGATGKKLIEEVSQHEYITYVIAVSSEAVEASTRYIDMLGYVGVSREDVENGGVWIGNGGKAVKIFGENDKSLIYDFDRYNMIKIENNPTTVISLGDEEYVLNNNMMTIFLWDTSNKKLIGVWER